MRNSGSNPWPAFADILFMLFVTTLIASAVITSWAVRSEERLKGCGASKRFMESFASCTGTIPQESENACKVSLGDEQLRFASGSELLEGTASKDFADKVSRCLADAIEGAVADPTLFSSIEFVAIDGYTDCEGNDLDNMTLGARRAGTLYSLVLIQVNADYEAGILAPGYRNLVLSKLTIRSFGRSRTIVPCEPPRVDPKGRPIAQVGKGSAIDRRVDIAVNSRLSER